jgi:hypothetical protein
MIKGFLAEISNLSRSAQTIALFRDGGLNYVRINVPTGEVVLVQLLPVFTQK